jgi:hypothetical protein
MREASDAGFLPVVMIIHLLSGVLLHPRFAVQQNNTRESWGSNNYPPIFFHLELLRIAYADLERWVLA